MFVVDLMYLVGSLIQIVEGFQNLLQCQSFDALIYVVGYLVLVVVSLRWE